MSYAPTDLLTVGEVARRAGIATSAVRFAEHQLCQGVTERF